MRKAIIALMCAGFFGATFGHGGGGGGLVVEDAGMLGKGELEFEVSAFTDFVEAGEAGTGLSITYGVSERFQIGMSFGWAAEKGDIDHHHFDRPELELKFSIIPGHFAVRGFSVLNSFQDGSSRRPSAIFGGDLISTIVIPSETEFNLNLGFGSNAVAQDRNGYNVATWGVAVVQPISAFTVGAEIFGNAYKGYKDTDETPEWTIGLGYGFDNGMSLSLGFGGDFETNDALHLTLGFTFGFGGN